MIDEITDAVGEVLAAYGPAQHATPAVSLRVFSDLAELGFPLVSIDEELGGSGGSVNEALTVLRALGHHGSGAPLAESGFLAGWLLSTSGLEVSAGLRALVSPIESDLTFDGVVVSGTASNVAWADGATALVALLDGPDGQVVVEIDRAEYSIGSTKPTVAGDERSRVRVESSKPRRVAAARVTGEQLLVRASASRVALISGALDAVRDLTHTYTNQREQFGQPVAKFQAVQAHLAQLAADAALIATASDEVGLAFERNPFPRFEVASATILARAAARDSSKAGHQAHGAMGVTREYPLHVLTRHLWQWAHDFGTLDRWRSTLLEYVDAAGADGYYPLITSGTTPETGNSQ
jgi:acyl-CoA dehydrogenase